MELINNTNINKYIIMLINRKQPSYESIYSFNPVKIGTLKASIETHLKTRFI